MNFPISWDLVTYLLRFSLKCFMYYIHSFLYIMNINSLILEMKTILFLFSWSLHFTPFLLFFIAFLTLCNHSSQKAPEPPPSKPHFASRLEPELDLTHGVPLVLKCKAGGYPHPKMTWYKDGVPLKNEEPYQITTKDGTSTLMVPQAQEDDGGVYSCVAANPSGQDTTSCNVSVAGWFNQIRIPDFLWFYGKVQLFNRRLEGCSLKYMVLNN